jgi:hypothetical protein
MTRLTFAELASWVDKLEPLLDERGDRYGYLVRMSADGRYRIEVHAMLSNYRICWVPARHAHSSIDRAWCYFGNNNISFIAAAMAALVWDGAEDTEPPGYSKRAWTEDP